MDLFGEEEATVLPPRETCDCTINLEPGGSIPYLLSTSSLKEFLDDSLKEGFNSRASNILRIENSFLFTATIQTLRLFLPIYGANKCIRQCCINSSPRRERMGEIIFCCVHFIPCCFYQLNGAMIFSLGRHSSNQDTS